MKRPTNIIDESRKFSIHEVFFSTTNSKGVIEFANKLFCDVSDYTLDELRGVPHSVVRHPDMPRCVFWLLWDRIQSGKPIVAYVKNMAADGRYYWVTASVGPFRDGYISTRMKPCSPMIETIKEIYASTLALEKKCQEDGMDRKAVIEHGLEHLMGRLGEVGFSDYETFMKRALYDEVLARHEAIYGSRSQPKSENCDMSSVTQSALSSCQQRIAEGLGSMLPVFEQVRDCQHVTRDLMQNVRRQSNALGTLAINCRISASSAVERAIAQSFGLNRKEMDGSLERLRDATAKFQVAIDSFGFRLSTCVLQSAVCAEFAREIEDSEVYPDESVFEYLQWLLDNNAKSIDVLNQSLQEIELMVLTPRKCVANLQTSIQALNYMRITGIQEAAALDEGNDFRDLFANLQTSVDQLSQQCLTLDSQVDHSIAALESLFATRHGVSKLLRESESICHRLAYV